MNSRYLATDSKEEARIQLRALDGFELGGYFYPGPAREARNFQNLRRLHSRDAPPGMTLA